MKQKATLVVWGLTISIFIITTWFYTQIEGDTIVSHWNAQGEADGYSNKGMLFFFVALIPLLDGLFLLLRNIDPRRRNYEKFEDAFQMIRIIIACFFSAFTLLVSIAQRYPERIDIGVFTSVLAAILFIFIGNYMPRMRRNFMMGFRTPWTLSSETVWRKTHRLCGRFWFYGGILLIFVSFLPMPLHLILFMSIVILISFIPCVYSYMVYRDVKRKGELYD